MLDRTKSKLVRESDGAYIGPCHYVASYQPSRLRRLCRRRPAQDRPPNQGSSQTGKDKGRRRSRECLTMASSHPCRRRVGMCSPYRRGHFLTPRQS